jgi:hypothetical protein
VGTEQIERDFPRGFQSTPAAKAKESPARSVLGGFMSKTVEFSFKTAEEKKDYEDYAERHGSTLPMLAKMSLFQYRKRHPDIVKPSGALLDDDGR